MSSGDVIIIQPRQPGALGTFAGTAAGVAAGTVIGDKITGRSESSSVPNDGEVPVGPCQYEEQQLLGCAQNETELLICESLRRAWINCKQKYSMLYLWIEFYLQISKGSWIHFIVWQ
ncbi:hemiasterlin resistant protein 1-like [Phymastichus coffea]|uniref:hemiasterlin resistant protein 1-like n=1 Tax=Phymastichus coffea TaxID=108790 RepID=UPI00273C7C71|nr:hemiasterlin resistant protein 1-like [Phymastichus coffea]